jgi:hypothetical protein
MSAFFRLGQSADTPIPTRGRFLPTFATYAANQSMFSHINPTIKNRVVENWSKFSSTFSLSDNFHS